MNKTLLAKLATMTLAGGSILGVGSVLQAKTINITIKPNHFGHPNITINPNGSGKPNFIIKPDYTIESNGFHDNYPETDETLDNEETNFEGSNEDVEVEVETDVEDNFNDFNEEVDNEIEVDDNDFEDDIEVDIEDDFNDFDEEIDNEIEIDNDDFEDNIEVDVEDDFNDFDEEIDNEEDFEVKPDTETTVESDPINETIENEIITLQTQFEDEVLELVNIERARYQLAPLTMDENVRQIARLKSKDMCTRHYFDHTSPTYGTPFEMLKSFNITYRAAAENIAQGQRTPEAVVNAWMNSPGHRANILNASYTKLGVGFEENGYYWTQLFLLD